MKTIIAGSRSITDYKIVFQAIVASRFAITEVVSGKARGVDTLGEQFAFEWHLPVKFFPADWESFGKSAGYVRNVQMAEYADALIAIWDGKSRGTKNMIDIANRSKLKVHLCSLI